MAIKVLGQTDNKSPPTSTIPRNYFRYRCKNGGTAVSFKIADKNQSTPTLSIVSAAKNIADLSFAQLKSFHLLTDYHITQELPLEMIQQVKGSKIIGFEDWYFEAVIRIFESKIH